MVSMYLELKLFKVTTVTQIRQELIRKCEADVPEDRLIYMPRLYMMRLRELKKKENKKGEVRSTGTHKILYPCLCRVR